MLARTIKQMALGILGLLAVSAANAQYACSVYHVPGSSAFGSQGYVYASFYAETNCRGGWVGSSVLCSTGASWRGCPADSVYHHSEASLLSHLQNLTHAADSGQRVYRILTTCPGGECTLYLQYSY